MKIEYGLLNSVFFEKLINLRIYSDKKDFLYLRIAGKREGKDVPGNNKSKECNSNCSNVWTGGLQYEGDVKKICKGRKWYGDNRVGYGWSTGGSRFCCHVGNFPAEYSGRS